MYAHNVLNKVNFCRRNSPVQLVKHLDDVTDSAKRKNCKFPAVAEMKYDGVWCGVLVVDGDVLFITRTGLVYTNLDKFKSLFNGLCGGLYITELINHDMSLEELSGLVNPNRKEKISPALEEKLHFHSRFVLHDVVSTVCFEAGHCHHPFIDRSSTARVAVAELNTHFVISPSRKYVNSFEEFETFAKVMIHNGHEGAVLKQLHADWEAGHKGWRTMKIVRNISYDLECVGYKYGKGKREGLVAALEFKFRDGKRFWADLGAGWNDEARLVLTQRVSIPGASNHPVGKVFKVEALQESSKGVLRLPKVLEERIDKTQGDF